MRRAPKVHLYPEPCDLRKSFDGLSALVRDYLGMDPSSGDQYAFTNRRRTRLKVLFADGSGLIVLSKRPDNGNCEIHCPRIAITAGELEGGSIERSRNGRRKQRAGELASW